MGQNSSLVTGGVTISAATLVPAVQWALPSVPDSVAVLAAAAIFTVGHAAVNFIRRKLGNSIADIPEPTSAVPLPAITKE